MDVKLKVVPFPAVFTSQMPRFSMEMIPPGSLSVMYSDQRQLSVRSQLLPIWLEGMGQIIPMVLRSPEGLMFLSSSSAGLVLDDSTKSPGPASPRCWDYKGWYSA